MFILYLSIVSPTCALRKTNTIYQNKIKKERKTNTEKAETLAGSNGVTA